MKAKRAKYWYDYLWVWTIIYFILGFFNIFFAWLGMADFLIPLLFAIIGGNKMFCNNYCGRGQLLRLIGNKVKFFGSRPTPRWMASPQFRYGFMTFFLLMFGNMLYQTWLVAGGVQDVGQFVRLLWTFDIPWQWAYSSNLGSGWSAQFSYGFYSMMLTSLTIGLITMAFYRPRSWCAFCPMGTMTQGICKIKQL